MPLITNDEWKQIESSGHLKREEFKDDPMKLDRSLVYKILNMRIEAGKLVNIHCAWANSKGHAPNSQHYLGKACDLNFEGCSLVYQAQLAFRHGFKGIGAYPGWNEPGIHVDVREGAPVYWIEPADKKGTGQYVYFHDFEEFLSTLGHMEG